MSILTQILKPLLFTGPAAPFGVLFSGLINLGATIGATYGTDALKKTTTSWPTLVVPPDKNNISTLIQAASTYQNQLIAGLNAQQNLENDPQFLYPLFSNVGLLRALANLNPLVLDSKSSDDQLGPNNPTAAAVTGRRLADPAARLLQVGANRPDDREPVAELQQLLPRRHSRQRRPSRDAACGHAARGRGA